MAGARVVGELTQPPASTLSPATTAAKGKSRRPNHLVEATTVLFVIFDTTSARPGPQRKATNRQGNRPQRMILDIFATRAPQRRKPACQVELAQLEYAQHACRKMWSHLSKLQSGIWPPRPGAKRNSKKIAPASSD